MPKEKLSTLFHLCAYDISYDQAGDSVNYKFIEEGDHLYIFFQGSNSITDWVRNFFFKKLPFKDIDVKFRVHAGFLAAWKEVEDIVVAKVRELDSNEQFKFKRITIVGYSHGGALAGLCHEVVWFWRPDLRSGRLIEGYGFEAPRFYGCLLVKKALRERWETFTVIRTNNDIVTHCPPAIFGYCHVGSILKAKGDKSLCPNKMVPGCVKSHYPEVVYDALLKLEGSAGNN